MKHIYASLPFYLLACMPSDPNGLMGESDRPVDPGVGFDSEMPNDSGDFGATDETATLLVEPDSIESVQLDLSEGPTEPLTLTVNAEQILTIEHILEWDDTDIVDISIVASDDFSWNIDYGEPAEFTRWLQVRYDIQIDFLPVGTHTFTIESDTIDLVVE